MRGYSITLTWRLSPAIARGSPPEGEIFKGDDPMATNTAADIVKSVGNYGEIYDRHLGSQSRAKLARGLNRLWTQGGLMYAPTNR